MDIQAICVELHKAARSSLDAVLAKHSMLMEESEPVVSRLNHRKIMKSLELRTLRQLLKCAEDDLRDAQDSDRDPRNACRDGTPDKCPRRALPPEIIQYIISLAYDNETLEAYQGEPDYTGARNLAMYTHLRMNKSLLSSTTLQVDFSKPGLTSITEYLKHTFPLKLQVDLLDQVSPYEKEFLPVFLQHISRMKSLTLHHCNELNYTIPVLPYLEHLTFLFVGRDIGNPNWTKMRRLLQESGPPKLCSSTLPSCFLAGFISSGFLRNVIRLSIHFDFGGIDDDDQWPHLDQCLTILSQLQKLTSLQLKGTGSLKLYGASDGKRYGFTSLKRLRLTSYDWGHVGRLVSRFSACDLKEISFRYTFGPIDIDVFASTLSDTFPHLGRLQIPTIEARKLLRRAHRDSGNVWNFPLLHTLDIRHTSYSSENMFNLIDVLRDRAGPEAHTLGVLPINCLFIKEQVRFCQDDYELDHYALAQLVPNVVWDLSDIFDD